MNATDSHKYAASYYGGLRDIVVDEIRNKVGEITIEKTLIGRRYDYVLFYYAGSPKELEGLRAVENLFVVATDFDGVVVHKERGLDHLKGVFEDVNYSPCIEAVSAFRGADIKPSSYITTLQTRGKQRFAEKDVHKELRTTLKQTLGEPDGGNTFNIRCQIIQDKGFIGIQLSPQAMKAREYKLETRPGSLDPTVAYALVTLANPQPSDVFLDAMCGAGTIAIEAATQTGSVVCGDIDSAAAKMTRTNASATNASLEVVHWDAGQLPLASASVDCAASNLPFGKDIPLQKPAPFIRGFLDEAARVLRSNARLVVLTAHAKLVGDLVRRSRTFKQTKKLTIKLYGIDVGILVLKRIESEPKQSRRQRRKSRH